MRTVEVENSIEGGRRRAGSYRTKINGEQKLIGWQATDGIEAIDGIDRAWRGAVEAKKPVIGSQTKNGLSFGECRCDCASDKNCKETKRFHGMKPQGCESPLLNRDFRFGIRWSWLGDTDEPLACQL